MWLEDINIYLLGLIIFVAQIGFMFSRTLNVIYTAEHNTPGALISGAFVHLMWLISISIGVKSVMYLDFFVILCSLSGGLLGTHYGIKLKKWLIARSKIKNTEHTVSKDFIDFIEKNVDLVIGNNSLVFKYNKDKELLDIYYSIADAAERNNMSRASIYKSTYNPFETTSGGYYYIKKE